MGGTTPVTGSFVTMTVTVCTAVALAASEQVNVNVFVAAVSALLVVVPLTSLVPVQAPLAAHVVVLVLDHVSSVVSPLFTLSGFTDRLTVGVPGGGDATVTVTLTDVPPLALEQIKV